MTRTFLKGKMSEEQRKLCEAVQAVHDECVDMLKAGVKYSDVSKHCNARFTLMGYPVKLEGK